MKLLKALMISMSVGCLRACKKIILIKEQDLHQFVSANVRLPTIHWSPQIQNILWICICKRTGPRSTCTSVTLTHSLPRCPPRLLQRHWGPHVPQWHSLTHSPAALLACCSVTVEQVRTFASRCRRPAVYAQTWCAETRLGDMTCAETRPETRPPISQCYHRLQKKLEKPKMSVLLRKTGKTEPTLKQEPSHHYVQALE